MSGERRGPDFSAGRDVRGAFATGAGAEARTVEAGVYIERYVAGSEQHAPAGPIFYNLPSLPLRYQARDELAEVRAKLLGGTAAIGITSPGRALGLKGMGGIGKTVLATALVHDRAVRAWFADGIVWLTVGRNAPILAKAAELAAALTGAGASFDGVSQARGRLGQITAAKRLLLVLDDVWEPGAVDPFTGLGADCRLLITSRDLAVLERAQADTQRLDLLAPDAARTFLSEAVGCAEPDLPAEADSVIRECGRLPLALAAVGALIRKDAFSWDDALAALQRGAADKLPTAALLPDPEQRTLAGVLNFSIEALSDRVLDCWLACAPFREDTDIPEAALIRVWSDRVADASAAKLIAGELVDRSLMQRDEQRRYRIHDLYMDHLRRIAAPLAACHGHLLDQYAASCSGDWAACPDDGYALQHLPWHLHEAGRTEALRALLFDPAWIRRKIESAGVNAGLHDYELLADDREASRVAAALRLSAHVLDRGPDELAPQLCGRLTGEDGLSVARLLQALRNREPEPLLPIRNGYLTRPGALLRTITVGSPVTAIVALPDGRGALSGSGDGTLRLWDVDNGAELRRFAGHEDAVTSVAALPDGHYALSGSRDRTLRVWDLDSGAEVQRVAGPAGPVWAVAVLPEGRRALSGSEGALSLWNLDSGAELRRFTGHAGGVLAVAVPADGRRAFSGGSDCTLRLWDLDSGAELRRFERHRDWVTAVSLLPDGRRGLSGGTDRRVRLWDLDRGAQLQRYAGHAGAVSGVAVLANGGRVLSGSLDGTLRVWNTNSGTELGCFVGHAGPVVALTALRDGRRALSGSIDGTLRLWDLDSTGDKGHVVGHRDGVSAVAMLPGGQGALSASTDGTLRLWTVTSGIEKPRFVGQADWLRAAAVLPDGRRALSGSSDGVLRLWDLNSGVELRRFEARGAGVWAVAVLPDGRQAVSGSTDGTVRLWDLYTGTEKRRLTGHSGWVRAVAILPDRRWALSGSIDNTLRLWDLESGAELRRLEGHSSWVHAVAALPGRRALSGSDDGTVRLWDIDSGAEERRLSGHGNGVTAVAVLSGGKRALSGSSDCTIRLWDLESGRELARFTGDDPVTAIAVSPEESRLVVGDARGRVMFLALPS